MSGIGIASASPGAGSPKIMVVLGGVVVAGVLLWVAFLAVDGWGLAEQEGTATVISKEYREPGKTFRSQRVGNRTITTPQVTGEMYILGLDIEGSETEGPVDKSTYEAVDEGDKVDVVYRKRRILGQLQVVEVRRR